MGLPKDYWDTPLFWFIVSFIFLLSLVAVYRMRHSIKENCIRCVRCITCNKGCPEEDPILEDVNGLYYVTTEK